MQQTFKRKNLPMLSVPKELIVEEKKESEFFTPAQAYDLISFNEQMTRTASEAGMISYAEAKESIAKFNAYVNSKTTLWGTFLKKGD